MERGYNVAVAGIPKTIDNDGKLASAIETLFMVHCRQITHNVCHLLQLPLLINPLGSTVPWKPLVFRFARPRRRLSATFPTYDA